jgi:hypothetical protein
VAVVVTVVVVAATHEPVALEVLRLVDRALGVTTGNLLAGGVLVASEATAAAGTIVASATAGVGVLIRVVLLRDVLLDFVLSKRQGRHRAEHRQRDEHPNELVHAPFLLVGDCLEAATWEQPPNWGDTYISPGGRVSPGGRASWLQRNFFKRI